MPRYRKSRKGAGNHNSYKGKLSPSYKHGMRGTILWSKWNAMKQRCSNPKTISYKYYGGRGIKVCDRWKDFMNFYEDMGKGYKKGLSIDRIDNNKGYSPENCRWSTPKQQNQNTRANVHVKVKGESFTIRELSDKSGINYMTLYNRIFTYGIPPEIAISKKSFAHGQYSAKAFLAPLLANKDTQ